MELLLLAAGILAVIGFAKYSSKSAVVIASADAFDVLPINAVTKDLDRPSLEAFAKLQVGDDIVAFLAPAGKIIPAIECNFVVTKIIDPGGVLAVDAAFHSVAAYSPAWSISRDPVPQVGSIFRIPGGKIYIIYKPGQSLLVGDVSEAKG